MVGAEHEPFTLGKTNIEKCHYLSDLVRFDEELRSHIKLYDEDKNIAASAFAPVAEYLQSGDFRPRLLDRAIPQVEGVMMLEQHLEAVQKIASVYLTASKLHLASLQDLCLRKITSIQPMSAEALLLAVRYNACIENPDGGGVIDSKLRPWLVDQVAEQFFKLYDICNVTMSRVMRDDARFREEVIVRLQGYSASRERDMS